MSSQPPYTPPTYHATAFNCPYCHAYAEQLWGENYNSLIETLIRQDALIRFPIRSSVDIAISTCAHCNLTCVWLDKILTVPDDNGMPPNDDMLEDIKNIYKEAASISQKSPRAAAALLRLALQMLCKQQLGGKGKNIYADIQQFFEEGRISVEVQKSMNAIREVGNEAAHPGVIDFNENPDVANMLFEFINFIADEMLTKPKGRKQKLDKINALTNKNTAQNTDKNPEQEG